MGTSVMCMIHVVLNGFESSKRVLGAYLVEHVLAEITAQFKFCMNCYKVSIMNNIPPMIQSNNYTYPPKPIDLPKLDFLTEQLVSQHIRRLSREDCFGLVGQITNMPVDVKTMVRGVCQNS